MMNKLPTLALLLSVPTLSTVASADDSSVSMQADSLNTEFFELGMYVGMISVQDFTTEPLVGVRASFHASENFFLQLNYAQAEVDDSSYELNQKPYFSGSDRDYISYDVLLGYNVFQGEVFMTESNANLSALYVVAGVGNTEFGGEENFSYTLGAGYRVDLTRNIVWSVDLRDHSYKTSLIKENDRVHNLEFSSSLNYLF